MGNVVREIGMTAPTLVLVAVLFGVAAPTWAQYAPHDPKENILTVEIWDVVVTNVNPTGGHSVLHVSFYTEEASGESEVSGKVQDGDWNWYKANHPDGTNQFHVVQDFGMLKTGETMLLAAYAGFSLVDGVKEVDNTDRAPNSCFYEYVFGDGSVSTPVVYDDSDDWEAHPKENILSVVLDDSVMGGHSVLHVQYWTEATSGAEVSGWVEDKQWIGMQSMYHATHAPGTNEFDADHEFGGDKTGETVLVTVYASCGGATADAAVDVVATDRAPNYGYYQYTFGTGPRTYDDSDDGPPIPPGVGVCPTQGFWSGIPSVFWQEPITFSYQSPYCISGVSITIEVDGTTVVDDEAMTCCWSYSWTPYPYDGQATVTYKVTYCDSSTETIVFPLLIDPSGIVFNLDTGTRIPGATVTLYYSTSATGPFTQWTSAPPAILPASNPQTTDLIGHYGWDVVGGYYWYVHVEKAGFESKDSPVVYVPPEVTTLNVWLKPLGGPPGPRIPALPMIGPAILAAMAISGGVAAIQRKRKSA